MWYLVKSLWVNAITWISVIYHARNSCRDFQRLVKHNLLCLNPRCPSLIKLTSRLSPGWFQKFSQQLGRMHWTAWLATTYLCRCSRYLGACFKTTSCSPTQSKHLDGIPITPRTFLLLGILQSGFSFFFPLKPRIPFLLENHYLFFKIHP